MRRDFKEDVQDSFQRSIDFEDYIREINLSSEKAQEIQDYIKLNREYTRTSIVRILLSSFVSTLIFSGILTGFAASKSGDFDSQIIKDWTSIMLTVQSGFIGGAIGFYFGTKAHPKK